MTHRKISAAALVTRIGELTRKHQAIDAQIEMEQMVSWPDTGRLRALKRQRLKLKDALHATRRRVGHMLDTPMTTS